MIPDPVEMLRNGAALVLSVSGGKDSDAMSHYLMDQRAREGWSGPVHMVHADLGRAEWPVTAHYVDELAQRKGVALHVVRRANGDLLERFEQRWEAVNHTEVPWSSAAMRYCTSDLKRGPIDTWLRNQFPENVNVVCAQGLRAEESPRRAKALPVSIREDATAVTKNRLVVDWLPIHGWKEAEVWECIRTLGDGIHHPAYDFNPLTQLKNKRVSCVLCILADEGDLRNGARQHPDIYRWYCAFEAKTGYSFRQKKVKRVTVDFWLTDLCPDLLPEETLQAVAGHKARRAEESAARDAAAGKPVQIALL